MSTPSATTATPDPLGATDRLQRVQRGVRLALVLGIAASLGANVLHAEANTISRIIAAWPPAALAITVELVSRVPVTSKWLAAVRITGTTAVAGIAAVISYMHMRGVALAYGESPLSATMIPLSVDGMIVVASVCLVEVSDRLHACAVALPSSTRMDPLIIRLLPHALEAAHAIALNGAPPSRSAIASALRDKGHSVPRHKRAELHDAVKARWITPAA